MILLAFDHVARGGRVGVFEIRHEHVRAGIQGVDDHLAVGGAGDFGAAIVEIGRDGRDGPVGFADLRGFGQEIRQCAFVDLLLANLRGVRAGRAGGRRICGAVPSRKPALRA